MNGVYSALLNAVGTTVNSRIVSTSVTPISPTEAAPRPAILDRSGTALSVDKTLHLVADIPATREML
ncbi:hypothetical protein [Rhodococcus sp. NPDC003348]